MQLRLGNGVVGLTGDQGHVSGVELSTGEVLPADVVVVAIGASPATEWLADSGLELDNGVVCDSRCQAAPGIYAVGDVARWHHEQLGRLIRLENRTNATEQAMAVAGAILGEDRAYEPVPYFWTDQFDAKLQVHGFLPADAEVDVVEGSWRPAGSSRATAAAAGSPGSSAGTCPSRPDSAVRRSSTRSPPPLPPTERPGTIRRVAMKVVVDEDKCVAAGQCVAAAMDVFDQRDEDGIVVLLNENPPAELADDVRNAAAVCPALAIRIEE